MSESTATYIKTRFLVFSDTHGMDSPPGNSAPLHADVAIHCGDLTTGSYLDEYKAAIRFLQAVNAPLKLVIPGNHDFTMDIPMFEKKIAEAGPLDPDQVRQVYGGHGEARELFGDGNENGITFLDEGIHSFRLQNGALLTVYASPFTPSLNDWGFQYDPARGHDFQMNKVDVVITHGPPRGILDSTHSGQRAGCPYLFKAIAHAKPLMHCFGHIHGGWGAKLVRWRRKISTEPSHLTDIDNENSFLISRLSALKSNSTHAEYVTTSHCSGDHNPLKRNSETLFVNAAIEGSGDLLTQPPWVVDLELAAVP